MKYTRIGRTLICFMLVCVLLVNVSPIRAEALSPGLAFAAGSAVASALIGLGISMGADSLAHNELVQEAVEALKLAGHVTAAGTVALVSLGSGRFAVKSTFIDSLRSFLWNNRIIESSSPHISNNITFSIDGSSYTYVCGRPFAIFACNYNINEPNRSYINHVVYFVSEKSGTVYRDTLNNYYRTDLKYDSTSGLYLGLFSSGSTTLKPSLCSNVTCLDFTGNSWDECDNMFKNSLSLSGSINTSRDLSLNFVSEPGLSLTEGYPVWHANSISIPNVETGEDEDYYPLALGQTQEETQGMTQEDVWAGNGTYVESVPDSGTQSGLLSDVLTAIKAIPGQFADWFADVISWGQSIWEAITALPQAIVSGITEVLADIFIPSADFLTAKVAAIRAEYAFADSVIATGQFIGTALTGLDVEPPVIYIHLEDTEGSYDIGGTVPFIDMTWYSRYKPTVDLLISALLWIVFAWRVFVKLPGIIGGMPGDFVMDALNHIGFADHMPSRKAEYEVQRISLREQIRRGKK